MYPTGHTYNNSGDATTPATTDVLSAIRGAATKITFTLANLITFLKTNLISAMDSQIYAATELTASGAIASTANYVELNNDSVAIAATIAAPTAGRFLVITQTDTGTAGHTVTLTAGTYDGTNNIATFNAAGKTLVLFGVSATRFVIVENIGLVTLS
jgi:hypothetical protein